MKQLLKQLAPIFKAYGLRANRKREFDQARKIKNNIDSKVYHVISLAGI